MGEQTCADCKYYLRHYSFDNQKLFRVYCGHCTFKRPRPKKPDAKVCEHFVTGVVSEYEYVSKEYLSKRLLERVLSMELLPKIEDM